MNSALCKELGENILGERNSKCKGPETEMSIAGLETSKEASVGMSD